ncbi:MAG: PAS domain S-box protein [Nitrospirae bacterium]|nr:MAG: PAS domain S-box protein [Nitrospirota bacterium]
MENPAKKGRGMDYLVATPQQLREEIYRLQARIAQLEASEARRKQAEITLRAAAEEWEQSFNALSDDVFILDKTGIILWANKAVRERFGTLHGNLIGLDYRILYYGTPHLETSTPWESVLAGAVSAVVEIWLPKLKGWFLVSCYPLYDMEGKQWGAISVVKDITDRRRVEEALRDIAQGAPAAGGAAFFRSLVKDLAKALDVSYAFLAEFVDPAQTRIHTIAVWTHGEYGEPFTWTLPEALASQIRGARLPFWGNDMRQHILHHEQLAAWGVNSYVGSPLVNSVGQIIGVIMALDHRPLRNLQLAQSILGVFAVRAASELERKRAEEALRDNEERYRAIAENAYDLIFETTPNGVMLYLSPSCREVLGYSLEELQQRNFLHLIHPDDRSLIADEFERKVNALEDWQMVCRLEHQTEEWRWFESHIKPFRTTMGDKVAVIVSRDITERRRLDEERARATKLESIGILAGGIAHDFNNILTAVFANIGLAKMLISKTLNTTQHMIIDRLNAAEKACMRARDLTKQLLTFAKGGTPVKNPASVARLITETAEFALRGSNVRCELDLPETLWPVEVDEGQMSQVIQNLIINADHAMPNGGIIRITASNVTLDTTISLPLKPGRYVKVSIEDQGTGIHPEHLPKIFDPYFTTKQKGSGLGLATTYSILKRHEGHITVNSELGVGTTFTFYLPASERNFQIAPLEEAPVSLGTGRILVMEDEEEIREVLGKMLVELGYEVDFAHDGTEILAKYQQAMNSGKPYIATIMDLTIPGGVGGKESIRQLKALDPSVVALVSSGYSNDPVMANPEDYGFSGIVAKPYNLVDLSKALSKALGSATYSRLPTNSPS